MYWKTGEIMASLSNDGGNKWRILIGSDRHRKAIRYTGPKRDAERFKDKVERLAATQGDVPADLVDWLNDQPDKLHRRLVNAGLTNERRRTNAKTLGQLIDAYFEHLSIKPITRLGYEATRKALLKHFGNDTTISSIEPLAAQMWRKKLKDDGLADATISKRIVLAKCIFRKAVAWKWICDNPFAEVKAGSQQNKARQYFITREMADKVLAACPTLEWKLIFALSRYGGLRCPSEHANLKWSDILWDQGKFRVTCSKTEHHAGRGERMVPLFPELEPLLLEAYRSAPKGSEYVLPRIRGSEINLRTHFSRIVCRAGLQPWVRLFHNLRSSRQTELANRFPAHVVCDWIGNSEKVAQGHYLQVTDENFKRAIEKPEEKAAQKAAQYGANLSVTEGRSEKVGVKKSPENASSYIPLLIASKEELAAPGLEPGTLGL